MTTTVYVLAMAGTNLYAGTWNEYPRHGNTPINGGVYLSTDFGTNWTQVLTGEEPFSVGAIAINGINLFAGGDGVFLFPLTTVQVGLRSIQDCRCRPSCSNFCLFRHESLCRDAGIRHWSFYKQAVHSWTSVNSGLPKTTFVSTLAVLGTKCFRRDG